VHESQGIYQFRADETTFYFVAFCVSFAVCMALSNGDRGRRKHGRISVAIATALVSCGILGITLGVFDAAGAPLTSPWPGLGMAAILGSLKERVYAVGWDVLKWFWKGRINFVVDDKEKQQ